MGDFALDVAALISFALLKTFTLYLAWAFITWLLFLAVMTIKQAHDANRVPKEIYPAAYLAIVLAVGADFIWNVLASVPFLEVPHEWLFTKRVERHMNEDSWRGRLSRWCCRVVLDPFQIGGHCRP